MPKNIDARIQHKHDTQANWENAADFQPKAGEIIIYDPDDNHPTPRIKIGDGVKFINELDFIDNGFSCGTSDPDENTPTKFYFKYTEE